MRVPWNRFDAHSIGFVTLVLKRFRVLRLIWRRGRTRWQPCVTTCSTPSDKMPSGYGRKPCTRTGEACLGRLSILALRPGHLRPVPNDPESSRLSQAGAWSTWEASSLEFRMTGRVFRSKAFFLLRYPFGAIVDGRNESDVMIVPSSHMLPARDMGVATRTM